MHANVRSSLLRTFGVLDPTSGLLSVPECLAPAVLRPMSQGLPSHRQARTHRRNPGLRPFYRSPATAVLHSPSKSLFRTVTTNNVKDPQVDSAATLWLTQIERLLPPVLKLDSFQDDSSTSDDERLSQDLIDCLATARGATVDLLYHLGVYQGRWRAVIWIVRMILRDVSKVASIIPLSHLASDNPQTPSTLNGTTASSFKLPVRSWGTASRSNYRSLEDVTSGSAARPALSDSGENTELGHLWLSLGRMSLAASDKGNESKRIMDHVLQILAHLHHVGAIPDNLYDLSPVDENGAFRRPPTLHLLSSRILTSLSDASWRAHEELVSEEAAAVGAEYHYLGHEVPGASYKFRLRPLGPEVWVETVLWCCVEGGFYTDGAHILKELVSRWGTFNQWSAVDWEDVQRKVSRENQSKTQGHWGDPRGPRERWGIAVGNDGYNPAPPLIALGDRTISSEVVKTVIDGLLDELVLAPEDHRGHSPQEQLLLSLLGDARALLCQSHSRLHLPAYIETFQRRIQSRGHLSKKLPWTLGAIVASTASRSDEARDGSTTEPSTRFSTAEDTNALDRLSQGSSYLLLRAFAQFVNIGYLRGASRIFSQMESVAGNHDDSSNPAHVPSTLSLMPDSLISRFLDLVVEAEAYQVGHSFLEGVGYNSECLPEKLTSRSELLWSMSHFASACLDGHLLTSIVKAVGGPLPVEVVHAYFVWHLKLRKWDEVDAMLDRLYQSPDTPSLLEDVMMIAATLLRMKTENAVPSSESTASNSVRRARSVLHRVMRRPIVTSGVLMSEDQEINPGSIIYLLGEASKIVIDDGTFPPGRRHQSAQLPARAFNHLLRSVAECLGPNRARKIYKSRCQQSQDDRTNTMDQLDSSTTVEIAAPNQRKHTTQSPMDSPSTTGAPFGTSSPRASVRPNVVTIQILMREVLQAKAARMEQERSRIDESGNKKPRRSPSIWRLPYESTIKGKQEKSRIHWGAQQLEALGLPDEEIREELQGLWDR
ncbi:MAG: hypothetical protein M1833_001735 [Piccolia ochrophora]|nr:MAG: hypothetical protein M1833_001735 [Piccolia ochrophora]